MARKVTVVVESGKDLYSCVMTGTDDLTFGLTGDGKTAKAAMEDFLIADKEMREFYEEEGKEYPDLEFHFVFDVGAFFNYYPLSISAFAKYIGMNQFYSTFKEQSLSSKDDCFIFIVKRARSPGA